ncbi:MAG: hypothetical protein IJT77_00745 [Clostridia bacterium]|nr:hypothetical protein [Clostridia bacterium]
MRTGTRWMLLLICGILLFQVISATGGMTRTGSDGLISSLRRMLPGQDDAESLRAQEALTGFLNAWADGDTETLIRMMSVGPDAPGDDAELLRQTLGLYRLSDYRLEGEITDLSAKRQGKRRTYSCLALIRERTGWTAFRILPEMVKSGGSYLVDADSLRSRTRIALSEYESPATAVHEQM